MARRVVLKKKSANEMPKELNIHKMFKPVK
jgi:hypothetical protein